MLQLDLWHVRGGVDGIDNRIHPIHRKRHLEGVGAHGSTKDSKTVVYHLDALRTAWLPAAG
jgi:hypothetical protein